jgi:hypothetical protein
MSSISHSDVRSPRRSSWTESVLRPPQLHETWSPSRDNDEYEGNHLSQDEDRLEDIIKLPGKRDSFVAMKEEDKMDMSKSLSTLNPFTQKRHSDQQIFVYMREVLATGEVNTIQRSLWELLEDVNTLADHLNSGDSSSLGKSFSSFTTNQRGEISHRIMRSYDESSASTAVPLRLRDLRRLDFETNPSEEPSILVRRHALVVTADPIRAVVMSSRVVVIVPPGGMDSILDILSKYILGEM